MYQITTVFAAHLYVNGRQFYTELRKMGWTDDKKLSYCVLENILQITNYK